MFNLTDEQDGIVKATPNPGKSMIVTAFAGTGKTFTLERYAEARPRDRILYAAFNKAIQLEAERKMPTNVMARTTHSLAYRAIGAKYQKEGKLQSNVPVWRISTYLGTSNIVMANFVLTVVKQFLASADSQIIDTHIPQNVIDYYVKEDKPMPPLVDMARGVWNSMSGFDQNSLPMVHDGYLKLYQLSGPVLDFDYILLDEAQDTTPCVWDIMVNQKGRKIVVGDPHQAIYGWRGAIDAMALVSDAETFYLTQSFRFGPKVAALASTLLRRFKKEEKPLRGLDSLDTEVSIEAPSGTRTVLARGNNLIFRSSAFEVENTKRNLGYVGGDHTNYRFQTYLDAFNLYSDKKDWIKDPVIKSFETFDELKEYADNVQSLELQGACVMVEEYKGRIPIIMRKVKERDVGAKYADLAYATGHKSKGLEFPVVQLANDFEVAIDAHLEMSGVVPAEELNLLYVAITRGTETLFIPSAVKTWIEHGSTKPKQKTLFDDKPTGQVKQGERETGMTMSKGDFLSRLLSSSPKGDGARDAVPERVKKFWE